MKHLYLSIILVVGYSINLFAQFNIGMKAGLSVSDVQFTGIDIPSNYRKGVLLGIPMSYKVSNRFVIGINNEFVQKGFNLEFDGQSNYTQYKYNYLQFTPNIGFMVKEDWHVGIGVYYAIKLGEYNKIGSDDWIDTGKFKFISDDDFGISPSIRYSYQNLVFQFRYQYGIKNIAGINFTDSNGEIIPDVKSHNKAFEIGLVYIFRL